MAKPNINALFNAMCDIANSSRALAEGIDTARSEIDNFQHITPGHISIEINDLKGHIEALSNNNTKQNKAIEEMLGHILAISEEVARS